MRKEIYYLITVAAVLSIVVYFIVTSGGTTKPTATSENSPILVVPEPTGDTMKKNKQNTATAKQWSSPPSMTLDAAKTYIATLKTTKGDITIALDAKDTPITVNNFVFLAQQKFYDNVIFHRIIKGFMVQSGDPTGTGSGGPGYRFDDELLTGDYTRGTVAMANAGVNTNGSQFFIMHADATLPKNYVIFGHVTSGMVAVDAIATAAVTAGPSGEDSQPVNPDKIVSVAITEN